MRARPETALRRIRKRARDGEASIGIRYLQQLHDRHERWLIEGEYVSFKCPIIVLNADLDFNEIGNEYDKVIGEVVEKFNIP
jgi:deoxynucleoside kinase